MRFALIARLRRLARWRDPGGRHRIGADRPPADLPSRPDLRTGPPPLPWERPAAGAAHGGVAPGPAGASRSPRGGGGGGIGRARIREAPLADPRLGDPLLGEQLADGWAEQASYGAAPVEAPAAAQNAPRKPWYQVVTGPAPARLAPWQQAQEQIVARTQAYAAAQAQARQAQASASQAEAAEAQHPYARAQQAARARLPYVAANAAGHPVTRDGRRHCGPLEKILHRQWNEGASLPAQVIAMIDRLAEFPRALQQKLADGLTGIYVGPGGVPELDDMGALRGVPLPSGRATWDACAGAYGERKIVVGSRPSPTPDVICHEVGHALDDLDSPPGKWQSDSPEFVQVYNQCKPHIVSDFHRQRGGLGRKEFFADAFAAIASGQRPALVDMLGGDTRTALRVMLYFNRRYGI